MAYLGLFFKKILYKKVYISSLSYIDLITFGYINGDGRKNVIN